VVREGGDGREAVAEPAVRERVDAALAALADLGCTVEEVPLPHLRYGTAAYVLAAAAEASANLARYDGVRYGRRAAAPGTLRELYARSRSEGFGPEVKRRILIGTFALSAGYHEAYYGRAQKARALLAADYARAFARVDVLVGPVAPTPAFRLGERLDDPLAMYRTDDFTVPASLAGLPAISVPCGATAEGLPVGVQIEAPRLEEARLLRVAAALEATPEAAP
jgi:aspartyl-tRNA(Asn)/glutamyl-tRNA(Gln) amidotransferase subunit A